MIKRNQQQTKWILGAIVITIALVFRTHQISQYIETHPKENIASPTNLFEFLEDFFGIGPQSVPLFPLSGQAPGLGGMNNGLLTGKGLLMKSVQGAGKSATQGLNAANNKNAPGNNAESNAEINSGTNVNQEPGNLSGGNSEISQQDNSQLNADNNPGLGTDNNPGNNPDANATGNSDLNAPNNPANATEGGSSDDSSGGGSTDNSGGTSQDSSGNNPSNGSGNSGDTNKNLIPTMNPIPSDTTVAQSIAQQNQQGDALATLLATRQALVVPVQQQAQATKYQQVPVQNIQPPSTNQPPADVIAKQKAGQLTLH